MTEVSLWDVYQAVARLDVRLSTLETRLTESALARSDQESRIRTLERRSYAIPASLLAAIAATVTAVLK